MAPYILTLDDMTQRLRSTFEGFTDPRQGKNTTYTLVDAALSAFAVFFLQSPSFLEGYVCIMCWSPMIARPSNSEGVRVVAKRSRQRRHPR